MDMLDISRREFLLATSCGVGTTLAGCREVSGPSEFQRRQVSLLSMDAVTAEVPYSLSLRVSQPTAVPEHPPQFTISMTNESNEKKHIEDEGVPNNLYLQHSSPPGYILIHWDDPEQRKPTCWEADEPYGMGGRHEQTELQPHEATTGKVSLWGTDDSSACWPTGEYTITGDIAIKEFTPGTDESTLWTFEWGFRFEVTHLE